MVGAIAALLLLLLSVQRSESHDDYPCEASPDGLPLGKVGDLAYLPCYLQADEADGHSTGVEQVKCGKHNGNDKYEWQREDTDEYCADHRSGCGDCPEHWYKIKGLRGCFRQQEKEETHEKVTYDSAVRFCYTWADRTATLPVVKMWNEVDALVKGLQDLPGCPKSDANFWLGFVQLADGNSYDDGAFSWNDDDESPPTGLSNNAADGQQLCGQALSGELATDKCSIGPLTGISCTVCRMPCPTKWCWSGEKNYMSGHIKCKDCPNPCDVGHRCSVCMPDGTWTWWNSTCTQKSCTDSSGAYPDVPPRSYSCRECSSPGDLQCRYCDEQAEFGHESNCETK